RRRRRSGARRRARALRDDGARRAGHLGRGSPPAREAARARIRGMIGSPADLGRAVYAGVRSTFLRTVVGSRSGAQVVALTFDDGPDPASTPAILRELARREARATFFLLGRSVTAHPGLARAIAEAGHAIGNHAFTHRNLA